MTRAIVTIELPLDATQGQAPARMEDARGLAEIIERIAVRETPVPLGRALLERDFRPVGRVIHVGLVETR